MRYNILKWNQAKDELTTLFIDTWQDSLEAAIKILTENDEGHTRGIIIDYSDKTVIAEIKYGKINTYDKGDRPNPYKKQIYFLLFAFAFALLGLFIL